MTGCIVVVKNLIPSSSTVLGVALPQCPLSNTSKCCNKSHDWFLVLEDESSMHDIMDVENKVTGKPLIELQRCHAFFSHGDKGICHCDVCYFVSGSNSTLVTDENPRMDHQWHANGVLDGPRLDVSPVH